MHMAALRLATPTASVTSVCCRSHGSFDDQQHDLSIRAEDLVDGLGEVFVGADDEVGPARQPVGLTLVGGPRSCLVNYEMHAPVT